MQLKDLFFDGCLKMKKKVEEIKLRKFSGLINSYILDFFQQQKKREVEKKILL